jgi:regulator of replication initiation timing/predicted GIY-YIG superfamily endonuclease
MSSTLNIVELIEKNPITTLSNTYQNKLITKIKENFNDDEQHLFVASFYCYLNCNKTDFIVDLDNIWKWLGFSQKAHAKTLLTKTLKQDIDYKILLSPLRELKKEGKDGRGGHLHQTILLTIPAFKRYCLKAGTEKASQIHEYYIKLEETLHEVIKEECNDFKLQIENKNEKLEQQKKEIEDKDKKLEKSKEEKELLREKTLIEQFPENTECVYIGLIDDTNDNNELLIKFGQTNNLKKRVQQHKNFFKNFRLIFVYRVENKSKIENCIKNEKNLLKYRRSLLINDINQTELLMYGYKTDLTITKLDKIIKKIILTNEYSIDNFTKILEENEKMKEELVLVKEENEKLKIENGKLLRNYKFKTIEKTEPVIQKSTDVGPANHIQPEYDSMALNLKRLVRNKKDGLFHINNNTYEKNHGTREEVWNGIAYRSEGGLCKENFILNKENKIVSKKKFISSKEENRLANVIDERKRKILEQVGNM